MPFSQYERNESIDLVMLFYNLLNAWGAERFLFASVSSELGNILAIY